jgi:alkylated DNA repair dioxygenase AlkB
MNTFLTGFCCHTLGDGCVVWTGELPGSLRFAPTTFEELWRSHPRDYGELRIHGRWVKTPRWQQAFGRDYVFSGQTNAALPIHPSLEPILDWARPTIDERLNGLLVNWYDGRLGHYIGKHRDSPKGLIQGSPIVTVSLGEERTFRLAPWRGRGSEDRGADDRMDVLVRDGTVLVVPYETNQAWTHAVPATRRRTGRRISITLRAFVDET